MSMYICIVSLFMKTVVNCVDFGLLTFEALQNKSKRSCVLSEHSDEPGHFQSD